MASVLKAMTTGIELGAAGHRYGGSGKREADQRYWHCLEASKDDQIRDDPR
jgi:hypothetical protein